MKAPQATTSILTPQRAREILAVARLRAIQAQGVTGPYRTVPMDWWDCRVQMTQAELGELAVVWIGLQRGCNLLDALRVIATSGDA